MITSTPLKQRLAKCQPQPIGVDTQAPTDGNKPAGTEELFPPEKAAKGRPKPKHFKSAADTATRSSTRKCAICGSKDHYTRSCPCHLVGPVSSSNLDDEVFLPQVEGMDANNQQDKMLDVEDTQNMEGSQKGMQIGMTPESQHTKSMFYTLTNHDVSHVFTCPSLHRPDSDNSKPHSVFNERRCSATCFHGTLLAEIKPGGAHTLSWMPSPVGQSTMLYLFVCYTETAK